VQAHNLRQEGDNLLVPMFDEHNNIRSVQIISPEGDKRFPKNSRKKGLYYPMLGDKPGAVICEGFATAASIQEATGYFVAVAFDCGNLLSVAEMLRAKLPDQEIIIAADNDKAGLLKATSCCVNYEFA
jgi:putative DNA primase/helicase